MFTTALVLTAIGGINWGLIALFDFNLVAAIFGADAVLSNLIYLVVGVAALYVLFAQLTHLGQHQDTRRQSRA